MNKIKERREALGLSQAALGEKIGCSQQHIQHLENGGEITPDKILSLSTVLSIPVSDLIPNNLKKLFQHYLNVTVPQNLQMTFLYPKINL